MKKNIYPFIIFGIISGFLSSFSFVGSLSEYQKYAEILSYGPGVVFGVTISLLLYFLYRKNILFHIIFVVISTGAFYVAVKTFSYFSNTDDSSKGLLLAGIVGSILLVVGLKLSYPIRIKDMIVIVMLGAILSLPTEQLGMFYFPVWQTVIAMFIGYAVKKATYLNT